MSKKPQSFRLPPEQIKGIKDLGYESNNQSIEKALDGYFALRRQALGTLKGIFTEEELIALVDMLNGTILTPSYQPSADIFLHGLSDFENLEHGVSRHTADYETMAQKIKALNPSQVYFLQEEIDRFWNAPEAYGSPSPELREFIERFKE